MAATAFDRPSPLPESIQVELLDFIPCAAAYLDYQFILRWYNPAFAAVLSGWHSHQPQPAILNEPLSALCPNNREAVNAWLSQPDPGLPTLQVNIGAAAWKLERKPVSGHADQLPGWLIILSPVIPTPGMSDDLCRLQAVFANVMDAILLIDNQGRFLDANPAACTLLGYGRDELIQLPSMWSISNLSGKAFYLDWWDEFARTGRHQGVYSETNRKGEFHYVEYRAVANVISGVHLAILRDITSLTAIEEKLRTTEELLSNILDYAPMPIYATSPDHCVQLANRAWNDLMGPFQRGVSLDDLDTVVSKETLAQFHASNDRVIATNAPLDCEEWVQKPDKELFFYTVKFPLRDQDGRITAVGGISVDITQRKQTELVLEESEKKFRRLVEFSGDGIILTDESGKIIEWNQAEERMTGVPAAEAIGQYLWDLQFQMAVAEHRTPENYQGIKNMIETLLQTGKSPWLSGLWETLIQRKDGSEARVQSNIFLIQTMRGYMAGSISRDITRERLASEEISQRNRELSSLLRISQELSSQLDLQRLLTAAVGTITDTLPDADHACLWLYDKENQRLVMRACSGVNVGLMSNQTVPVDGNVIGLVYKNRLPVNADLVDVEKLGLPAGMGIHSLLGVPLLLENRSIGAIFVANLNRSGAFDANDERWLQSLAGQVVVMAENARLFAEVSDSRARLQSLSNRLVELQEEERRRIARELHDEVGQILTGLKLLLKMTAHSTGEQLEQNLRESQNLTNELLSRVHDMSLDLRPAMLDDLGLLPALLWHFDRYSTQSGIRVTFHHHGLEGIRFSPGIETCAYRIIQEALTNAARHARVEQVRVSVWANAQELSLQVEDEGTGFDLQSVLRSGGSQGLNGMFERAAQLGGVLKVNSAPGNGTRLKAVIPVIRNTEDRREIV